MDADERFELIRPKIERADKHILDLHEALVAFRDSEPYAVGTKQNPETGQLIYYLQRLTPIPSIIPAIAGDVVNNLRSALDHLAYQLVLAAGNMPTKRTYFPTSPTKERFKSDLPGKVHGMRKAAIDDIKRLEPYAGGQGNELSILHALNNIDKHRLLVTVCARVGGIDLGAHFADMAKLVNPSRDFPTFEFVVTPSDQSPLKEGDELFITDGRTKPNNKINFAINVSLDEACIPSGETLIDTIEKVRAATSATIEAFRSHLD